MNEQTEANLRGAYELSRNDAYCGPRLKQRENRMMIEQRRAIECPARQRIFGDRTATNNAASTVSQRGFDHTVHFPALAVSASSNVRNGPAVLPRCQTTNKSQVAPASAMGTITTFGMFR